MTFYQELQIESGRFKRPAEKSETAKEKIYHLFVYMAKVAGHNGVLFFICYYFQHSAWK